MVVDRTDNGTSEDTDNDTFETNSDTEISIDIRYDLDISAEQESGKINS